MLTNKLTIQLTIPASPGKFGLTTQWPTQCIPGVGSSVCLCWNGETEQSNRAIYLKVTDVTYYPCDPRPRSVRELDEIAGLKVQVFLDNRKITTGMLNRIKKEGVHGLPKWSVLGSTEEE